MDINSLITVIKRHKQEFALSACQQPQKEGDAAFNYGRACGYVQGLEQALKIIDSELNKDEEDHGPRRRDRDPVR